MIQGHLRLTGHHTLHRLQDVLAYRRAILSQGANEQRVHLQLLNLFQLEEPTNQSQPPLIILRAQRGVIPLVEGLLEHVHVGVETQNLQQTRFLNLNPLPLNLVALVDDKRVRGLAGHLIDIDCVDHRERGR